MKVKATYRLEIRNPFIPDMTRITKGYSKTVEVPDDTDMKQLEVFAKEDTIRGFIFVGIEKVPDSTPVSQLKEEDETKN